MAVPVIPSFAVVTFVRDPEETVSFVVELVNTNLIPAPSGKVPSTSKLALKSQGAPWSGGKLFSWPRREISKSEFLI